MSGENFTKEYKYPIKIYRIGQSIEFANGLELRKLIFSLVLAAIMIVIFVVLGVSSDSNLLSFIAKNWLVLLTLVPAAITFVVFNLNYDNKGFIAFVKDRYHFYKTKNQAYEHFIEVPTSQMNKELEFEPFVMEKASKEGESSE
ncbi:TcpE family conjugal transfer membrane protein [Virgibacillus salexigens]|uniref:TcpE family conjugal transfer membrane protein n=1 Tax=Virgibacillus massiliensis TaxID=1462526 RepID=UPI00136CE5E5|nr:TcpE family conjugal transfer membrane protein [Virgibacillus massiliensis]MYL43899.1 conjugal transfer protein [Virgibacillus massiliensis]